MTGVGRNSEAYCAGSRRGADRRITLSANPPYVPHQGVHARLDAHQGVQARLDAQCRLLCIDPAQAADFWPHVSSFIEKACRRGLHDFAGAEQSVRSGAALLWIVWDEVEIVAALTTELHRINGRKLCFIATLGGKRRERWLHLIEGIESYATAEGCAGVIIMGRPGWRRALRQYGERGTILERSL
jgi:hypothetical protein